MMNQRSKTKTINETPALRRLGRSGWLALSVNKPTASALALLLCGGLTALATDNRAPEIPPQIAQIVVPTGNTVHFHGFGVGVQIYTWNGTSWGNAVPEATLFDDEGNVVVTHFGVFDVNGRFVGPAWESNSGSRVVGALPPIAGTVDPTAIPWLRLSAVPESLVGPGILADTTYIQRVNTTGGKAPSEDGTVVGQVARVPYTADYFFYHQSND